MELSHTMQLSLHNAAFSSALVPVSQAMRVITGTEQSGENRRTGDGRRVLRSCRERPDWIAGINFSAPAFFLLAC